MTQDNGKCLVT